MKSGDDTLHPPQRRTAFKSGLRPQAVIRPTDRFPCDLPVLHPQGRFLRLWNPLVFIAVILALVMAPFDVALDWWEAPTIYKVSGKVLDVLFICDVVMHFNTAIIHHGHVISHRKVIAIHYAKTYLLLDLISNTPWDWFFGTEGKSRKLVKIVKIPKILRFVKLLRVLQYQTQYVGVSTTVGGILLLAHYYSCFLVLCFLPSCDEVPGCPTVTSAYLEGLAVSMSSLVGADSGLQFLEPSSGGSLVSLRDPGEGLYPFELFTNACITITGACMLACLFANVAAALHGFSEEHRLIVLSRRIRKREMKRANIPLDMQEKVEATYEHVRYFGMEKDGFLRDPVLSLDLRRELALSMYGPVMRQVPFFTFLDDDVLKRLAHKVEMRLYTPGDFLMMHGEVGTELFIVYKGVVQAVDSEKNPTGVDGLMGPGSFFGETCVLCKGSRRAISICCVEFCRALVLCMCSFEEDPTLAYLVEDIRKYPGKFCKPPLHADSAALDLGVCGTSTG